MGQLVASHLAIYTSLAEIAAAALGGGEKSSNNPNGPITEDLSQATPEHFQARMSQLMSM